MLPLRATRLATQALLLALVGLLALGAGQAASAAPVLRITQPASGAHFFVGDPITLQASATDSDGADLGAGITWDSDLEGPLGRGPILRTVLPLGTHLLTASVSDGQGVGAIDGVTVDVVARPAGNSEPLATITAPTTAQPLAAGSPVAFAGTASDLEDGDLTAGLVWTSDRDGVLGTGGTCTHALSEGIHRITARVIDGGGLGGSTTVVVQVGPPVTLEFIPSADTYVDAGAPALAFGSGSVLRVDANTARHAYLRFAVSGVGARAVTQAVLRLQVDAGEGAGSDSGGTVYAIADQTWQEGTVTYRTRPALDGQPLASAGPVARGQVVDFDVTRAVAGDGSYDLALVNTSADEVAYRSREGGPPPRLVLTLSGHPPVVTITAPAGGSVVRRGDPLACAARAVDLEDGDLSDAITWSSSRDGVLGTGPTLITSALSLGTHIITATAADGQGAVGTAELQLTVQPPTQVGGPPPTIVPAPNALPVLSIGAPAGGTTLLTGKPVVLGATAVDAEDGDLGAAVRWTSSRDGALGAGATVVVPSLSVGTHTLTATVTDRTGAPGGASITVTVVPPMLSFPALADTYVDAGNPTTGFGDAPTLVAGTGPASRQAFLRFAVNGIGHFTVRQALLRLTARSASSAGGTVHTLTGGSWSETATTYVTRPAVDGLTLASQGAVLAGRAVDFDVTRAIAGDGSYDFALVSPARRGVTYASREAPDGQPALILTLGQAPAPVVVIGVPVMNATVDDRTAVSLVGTATAADGSDLSDRLHWTSSLTGPLGSGAAVTVPPLTLGTHMISATVADADGLAGEAHTTLQVRRANAAPTVSIIAPTSGTVVPAGTRVRLTALVADDVDQDIGSRLAWTSNRDGALGTGATCTVTLSPGTHAITAAVTDTGGLNASSAITMAVNAAPTLTITAPADGGVATPGVPLTLTADARDAEDGSLASRVVWSSSRDGVLGTGSPLGGVTLHSGTHILTATVTDSGRTRVSAAVTLIVNAAPTVAITAPLPFRRFAPGEAVALAATASDLEDGDLGAAVVWTSDIDGPLGTGTALPSMVLSPVTHVLTATVTDSGGRTAQASITLLAFTCLLQPGPLVTLTGVSTSAYTNALLTPAARIDARAVTFLASAANRYPIVLGGGTGVCFLGGTVQGQYDRSLTWAEMHYDNNNAGLTFDDDHLMIDSLRVDNVTDGIRPRADAFTIRNTRMSYVRDDCIENDHLQGGLVDDALLDGCYVAFSARPSQAIIDSGFNGAGKVWTIQNTLVRLQPMPGPANTSADGLGNGGFFKWHLWDNAAASLSPKLALHNNIFLAERTGDVSPDRMGIPPDQLESCANNIMVWLGPGAYPAALPDCFTVTTDRRVWDNAVADWELRHPQVPR